MKVPQKVIEYLTQEFAKQWKENSRPEIREYLSSVGQPSEVPLFSALVREDLNFRRKRGECASLVDYETDFPDLIAAVRDQLEHSSFDTHSDAAGKTMPVPADPLATLASSFNPLDSSALDIQSELDGNPRYELFEKLGQGAYGCVYCAMDKKLSRMVAVKIPHSHVPICDDYLAEARTLASMERRGIVPIFDVEDLSDGRQAVISKYIEGRPLDQWMKECQAPFAQIARLVSQVAESLHYAHRHGVTHRDVKPANILIDNEGFPWLVDFGMALVDEDSNVAECVAGTPSYISPEQARGDSNLVDGRSDIFALGAVLYELLTGTVPFPGKTISEILERVQRQEPRPPRICNDAIPKELERICLKALAKPVSQRYSTALDMAEELAACATYEPKPINVAGVELPASLSELSEKLAKNNHDVWSEQRIGEGWEYGDKRDDLRKTHPDLVPYEQLTEGEKEYDRRTVQKTLKAILTLGYDIVGKPTRDEPEDAGC